MKRFIQDNINIVGHIITLLIIIGFIVFLWITTPERTATDEAYNNGICAKCSGAYKFVDATATRSSQTWYFYSCEDCGYTIKTICFHN